MSRKNKTKIQRNRANAELLDDTLRSRDDQNVDLVPNVAVMKSPAEKVRHLLDILEKKDNELVCSRKLIDHLKTQSTTALEEKIQQANERERALENDRNSILNQLEAFRNKFEDIKDSSSSNIVKLKEENVVLEDKLLNTTKQLEKYKKELSDLERQFVITNQLVSESQKSSEVVKEEFQKLIAEKSAALVDALKSADNCQKTYHASAEELEKVRMKLAEVERDKLDFSESKKQLYQVITELEEVTNQKKSLEEKLEAASKLSETNEKSLNDYRQHLDAKFSKIVEEMEAVKSDVARVTVESEKVDSENQQLRKTIVDLEKSLSKMEEESKNTQDSKQRFESETKKMRDDYSKKVKFSNQKVNKLEKEVKKLLNEKLTATSEVTKLSDELKSKTVVITELSEAVKASEETCKKAKELGQLTDNNQKLRVKLESSIAEFQRLSENYQKGLENSLASSEKMLLEATKKSEQQEQQIVDAQLLLKKSIEQVKDQEKLEESIKTLEAQIEKLNKEKVDAENTLLNEKDQLSLELNKTKTELEKLAGKNSEIQTNLNKASDEVAELKKVGEKYKRKMEDKLAVVRSKLEKAEKLAKEEQEKCKQKSALETKKIEVLEQSNRQKRLEEELSNTRQKLEEALKKQVETEKENEKMADLETRIDILTSESIVDKNQILADLERVKNELAQSEESRETDAELVTKLQASLIEVRECFEEEKNHLAAALESTQQKLTAADETKTADSRMISQLENTVSALELALKTNVVEEKENPEVVKEDNNVLGQSPCCFETNEDLMAFANSYYRQLHHRLQILRQNQSMAFYPYIRYLIALYILLLHIWLLW